MLFIGRKGVSLRLDVKHCLYANGRYQSSHRKKFCALVESGLRELACPCGLDLMRLALDGDAPRIYQIFDSPARRVAVHQYAPGMVCFEQAEGRSIALGDDFVAAV